MFENAKRIYREIRILRLLSHANVVRITHLQAPSDLLAFNDLYIVFECLGEWWSYHVVPCHHDSCVCAFAVRARHEHFLRQCTPPPADTDFAKLTRDDTQCLTIPHVRWFLYQLLLSMKYVHSAHIIHR